MHLSKKVFLLGSQYGIQALTPLVIFPIAARVIGLEEFGILSSVLSISTFGMLIIQYSFNQEGIQWISREKKSERGIVSKIFKTKLILFFIVISFIFIFLNLFITKNFNTYLVCFSYLIWSLSDFSWYFQFKNKYLQILLINIFSIITSFAIFGIFHFTDLIPASKSIFILLFAPRLIASILNFCFLNYLYSSLKPNKIDLSINLLLRQKLPLFMSQFISLGYTGSGAFLLERFYSAEEAGLYTLLEKSVLLIALAAALPFQADLPSISESFNKNKTIYAKKIKKSLLSYLVLCFVGISSLLLISRFVFSYRFIFNTNIQLTSLFIFYVFFGIMGLIITNHLILKQKFRTIRKINSKILIISLSIGIPLIYKFGAIGWMLALISSQTFVFLPLMRKTFKDLKNY